MMPVTMILSLISFAVTCVLQTGYLAYTLKTIRHQESGLDELFRYFKQFVKLFCLYFMVQLFTALWSLLFVIPGIVKSYEYCMVPYILAENPGMNRKEAFLISKKMMMGQKWNTFVLDLSFLGWRCLEAITFGILGIFYVEPYVQATRAELYAYNRTIAYQNGYIR